MHYIAPIPIILGVVGVIAGFLWLVTAASEEGGSQISMPFVGRIFLLYRVLKALATDPMSVRPAFGILLVSAALIWVGVHML